MAGPTWREALAPEWHAAFEWVERNVGGPIVRFERHPRWRPAWYLDVERAGEIVPIYFRGDRGALDHGVYPLEHEMKVLQLLEKHAIPVPHVFGFCPEPRGIVMQRCPGRGNHLSRRELLLRGVLHELEGARVERID